MDAFNLFDEVQLSEPELTRLQIAARTAVGIFWIAGISTVGVFGSPWVAVIMCIVAVGGPHAARTIAKRFNQ